MSERICKRCRRVCFSAEEFANHECFDMDDKLDGEIALANWDGKLPTLNNDRAVAIEQPSSQTVLKKEGREAAGGQTSAPCKSCEESASGVCTRHNGVAERALAANESTPTVRPEKGREAVAPPAQYKLADEINQCLQIIITNAGNIKAFELEKEPSVRDEDLYNAAVSIEQAVERAKKATWAALRSAATTAPPPANLVKRVALDSNYSEDVVKRVMHSMTLCGPTVGAGDSIAGAGALIVEFREEAAEYERLSKIEKSDFATKFAYTNMVQVTREHADELARALAIPETTTGKHSGGQHDS